MKTKATKEKSLPRLSNKGAIRRAIFRTLRCWFYLGLLLIVVDSTVCPEINQELSGLYELSTCWTKQVSKFCEFILDKSSTIYELIKIRVQMLCWDVEEFVEILDYEGCILILMMCFVGIICTIILWWTEKYPEKTQEALEKFGLFLLAVEGLCSQLFKIIKNAVRKILKKWTDKTPPLLEDIEKSDSEQDVPPTE